LVKRPKIDTIDVTVIWAGRSDGATWFHPRPCAFPNRGAPGYLMTCQTIGSSDVFGHVHASISTDFGRTWSPPASIPGLGRRTLPDGTQEGVCDVVPGYHVATDTILALGHNVYYRDNVLTRPGAGRYPVYTVRRPDGTWSGRHKLAWPDATSPTIYTAGCAQRVHRDDGRILLPLSVGAAPGEPRRVRTALCRFDGATLIIETLGNDLRLDVGRGLLEPSLARWSGRYTMTIRAEDGHGYVTTSDDGLAWRPIQPWRWDDGEPLVMSTTQQHWITNDHGLYLVYTRWAEGNAGVMRWRAPLYIAQVDPTTLRLVRASERVAIPMRGPGAGNGVGDHTVPQDPDHIARMGNFHTLQASPDEAWITVGETLPADGWRGDTLLARVRWA
jgi:hypothetical protein